MRNKNEEDIMWSCGGKSLEPANNTRGKSQNWISKLFAMKKLKQLLNLNGNGLETRGLTIDKLCVPDKEIARGSNGTIVFGVVYERREVAVKRLSKALYKAASKEVQSLTTSDQHPNIVRLHGVEFDKDFVYIVLERCISSMNELVSLFAKYSNGCGQQDIILWKSNGYPSELLLDLMRDMVEGLVHLHDLGIIHHDIKPQNVMIAKGVNRSCAKLSGSSRWIPMEKKLHKRRQWSSDMYDLGCVFYFCLSRGRHLFDHQLGEGISNGNTTMSLHLVNHIPEATDLISRLLDSNPRVRPKAKQVLDHPLFWGSNRRLDFLRDVSDRLERETRNRDSNILTDLESVSQRVFGALWDRKMEPELVKEIGKSRYYNYKSLRDLLRVVRNMLNHYYQSPKNIQELLGPLHGGFDDYFSRRFPRLLMEVYEVVIHHCRSEKCLEKYFGVDEVSVV